MWNEQGEKFSGKVIQVRKNHFMIIELETRARAWIVLKRLNFWEYREKPGNFKLVDVNLEAEPPSIVLSAMPYWDEREDDITYLI